MVMCDIKLMLSNSHCHQNSLIVYTSLDDVIFFCFQVPTIADDIAK